MKTNTCPHALLVLPPVYDFALFDLFIKPYPLLVIGKSLQRAGYRVSLLNCLDYSNEPSHQCLKSPRRHTNGTGKFFKQRVEKPVPLRKIERHYCRYGIINEEIQRQVSESRPDVVLVTTGMTYWYPGVREVVQTIRNIDSSVPIIVGGIYATLLRNHCMKTTEADEVVSGPAFPMLADVLGAYGFPLPDETTPDDLLILHAIYTDAAVLRIHRGCPFRCSYCASFALSGEFREGDPVSAFALVRRIHEKLGTRVFAFYDDALLARKETGIIPFLHMVCDSGLDLEFYLPNGIHLCYCDGTTARLMRKAGFREVRIGVESTRPDFHHTFDRKIDIAALGEGISILKDAGFRGHEIGCYIMAGLPGQYREEVEESVHYVSRFGVRIYIAEYSPVPGTGLWRESVQKSVYPLEEEPLFHNNTILPLAWEHFTRADLETVKQLARSLSFKGMTG
jgi:radical SAM superfamily enzyme YgiQ (UPF0313 family)